MDVCVSPWRLSHPSVKNTGPDLPISFRLSVEHGIPGGREMEESQEIARRLEAASIDVIHAGAGCYESFDLSLPSAYMPDACLSGMAAAIKEAVHIPVIAVGKITPENGEALLESGRADFIATGRALVADPDWPKKVRTNRRQDVRPCIRCNEYCTRLFSLKAMSCTVNPSVGKERYYKMDKTGTPKRVLVIGGGPSGMEAARVATLRGHEVILVEKKAALGGQLSAAAAPSFKKELRHLIRWWERQLDRLGVDIRLNVEVLPETVALMSPDAVVVATGARSVIPDIPGIEGNNIIRVIDYHLGRKPVGEHIVVAGGGMAACDAALELAQQGNQVTIVEMLSQVAGDVNMVNRSTLLCLLTEWGVMIIVNHKIKAFHDGGVMAEGPSGEVKIAADAVILALGVCSEDHLAKTLKDRIDEIYVVGDCAKPSKVGEAVHGGFIAGYSV